MRAPHAALSALIAIWALAGCSAIPNLDHGSAGCQNATGIGPVPPPGGAVVAAANDLAIEPLLVGKSPVAAEALAQAQGHTVVFNVQIEG
jgi:hypothetical protein